MSLRKLFVGTFIVLVILGYGLVWFYGNLILITVPGAHTYTQIFVLMSIFLLVIAILFFIIIRSITNPIRSLTAAIDIYTQKNERKSVSLALLTPKEIRTLVLSFVNLLEHIEGAHKRTVEDTQVKSDFISTAAHQFRTPLTGIRWALEALEQDANLTKEQKMLVKSAEEKSRSLVSIVGTLLDVSSIESGKYRYTFAPVDIEELSLKTTQDFQHLAHERSIVLEYKPSNKHAPLIRADKERIQWILNNVIENALRYTPAKGSVVVWSEIKNKKIILTHIKDTGIGISSKDSPNIFTRFYRASNAVAKENAGTGLGLYIARKIANDHGGDLNFSANTDGVGTTFTLSLPMVN